MTWPPPVSAVAVIAVVSAAVVGDLKNRRIPNALTLGAAVVAVAMHAAMSGWPGLLLAASGWAVGAALFFPLFALGGMAAGDVKLLAAIGAWLGGGVMALVVALSRGYASTAMRNVGKILRVWSIVGVQPVEGLTLRDTASPRLPYALPLAAGALVTLWMS